MRDVRFARVAGGAEVGQLMTFNRRSPTSLQAPIDMGAIDRVKGLRALVDVAWNSLESMGLLAELFTAVIRHPESGYVSPIGTAAAKAVHARAAQLRQAAYDSSSVTR